MFLLGISFGSPLLRLWSNDSNLVLSSVVVSGARGCGRVPVGFVQTPKVFQRQILVQSGPIQVHKGLCRMPVQKPPEGWVGSGGRKLPDRGWLTAGASGPKDVGSCRMPLVGLVVSADDEKRSGNGSVLSLGGEGRG